MNQNAGINNNEGKEEKRAKLLAKMKNHSGNEDIETHQNNHKKEDSQPDLETKKSTTIPEKHNDPKDDHKTGKEEDTKNTGFRDTKLTLKTETVSKDDHKPENKQAETQKNSNIEYKNNPEVKSISPMLKRESVDQRENREPEATETVSKDDHKPENKQAEIQKNSNIESKNNSEVKSISPMLKKESVEQRENRQLEVTEKLKKSLNDKKKDYKNKVLNRQNKIEILIKHSCIFAVSTIILLLLLNTSSHFFYGYDKGLIFKILNIFALYCFFHVSIDYLVFIFKKYIEKRKTQERSII